MPCDFAILSAQQPSSPFPVYRLFVFQYYYWRKCINCIYCIFPFPVYTTGSHYSRSTSHSTVLRGSCLLYYRRSTCRCVCHFRSGLSATAIKEYCIVLYCFIAVFVALLHMCERHKPWLHHTCQNKTFCATLT